MQSEEKMKNNQEKINRFERHPRITLFIIIFASVVLLDFAAANIYSWIKGYPWSAKAHVLQEKMFDEMKITEGSYRIKSPVYHHDLEKNMSVSRSVWGHLIYPVCTNSLGFKDRVVRDVPLSSDKHRIVFIGDSFTEGTGFSYDDTFVGMIDRELSKKGIEVFNASAESYAPVIYWKKIEYLIKNIGFKFDEVIVYLDISDIQDEIITYTLGESGNVEENNKLYDVHAIFKKENSGLADVMEKYFKAYFKNNSILIYYLLNNVFNMNYRGIDSYERHRSFWTFDKTLYDAYGRKGLEQCALHMDKLHDLLKSRGIILTVAVYPWPGQVLYDRPDSIQVVYWRKWCAARQVSFINCFPYFLTGKNNKDKQKIIDKYYIRNDVHFNKDGHQLMATAFLDYYKTGEK